MIKFIAGVAVGYAAREVIYEGLYIVEQRLQRQRLQEEPK